MPCSRLRLTARQLTSENSFASVYVGRRPRACVRISRVASEAGSLIKGSSTSSSIVRLPSCDQIRSYSRRACSSVGCGDQSMPRWRRIVETDGDGAVALIEGHVKIHPQTRDAWLVRPSFRRGPTAPPGAAPLPPAHRSGTHIRPDAAPGRRSVRAGAPKQSPGSSAAPAAR